MRLLLIDNTTNHITVIENRRKVAVYKFVNLTKEDVDYIFAEDFEK